MNAKELITEWLKVCKKAKAGGHTVVDNNFVIRKLEQILQAMEDEIYLNFVLNEDA